MSCEKFEELLPLYVEGELAGEDRHRLDDHLAVCGACRESLALYREIESFLVSHRELRPSAARTGAAVMDRLRLGRERQPLFGRLGVPGLVSFALIAAGVALYFVRGGVVDFFARRSEQLSVGYSHVFMEWTQGLVRATGGSEWVLLSVYLGVFALVMLAGSWMVLRFVRE
jgi:anti-sigma factor RsiW